MNLILLIILSYMQEQTTVKYWKVQKMIPTDAILFYGTGETMIFLFTGRIS